MKRHFNEASLIEGLRKGEQASYRLLFEEYYAPFVNVSAAITGDRAASEDIVMDAMVKLWQNRSALNPAMSLRNFLFVIVKRASLNHVRDCRFETAITEALDKENPQVAEDERVELVRSLAMEMPQQRKVVFMLSRQEGLSNKEIAERMGISERTVERHISLALKSLRRELEGFSLFRGKTDRVS